MEGAACVSKFSTTPSSGMFQRETTNNNKYLHLTCNMYERASTTCMYTIKLHTVSYILAVAVQDNNDNFVAWTLQTQHVSLCGLMKIRETQIEINVNYFGSHSQSHENCVQRLAATRTTPYTITTLTQRNMELIVYTVVQLMCCVVCVWRGF